MSIQQHIQKLKRELSLKKWLFKLKEQTQQAQIDYVTSTIHEPHQKPSSSSEGTLELKQQWFSTFVLCPPDLHTYYSRTTHEHCNWFYDIKDAIEVSILYFPDDIVKIQYALCYIAADSKVTWRKYSKIILKNNWTWVEFEQFLLDHIEDSQN